MRLPPNAKICYANRANCPDHVLQLAHQRAPDGFENIDDVIGAAELEEVGKAYKLLAGFDKETVNKKAKETEDLWSSRQKANGTAGNRNSITENEQNFGYPCICNIED